MNEKYHFLMTNDTWDLVALPKGRKLSDVSGFRKQSMDQMEKLINARLDWLLKVFHKLRALTIPKPLPLLPK